jgi:hypothetical protein
MEIETKKFLLETAVRMVQKNIDQKIMKSYTIRDISELYYGLSAILEAQTIVDERERLERLKIFSE